MSETENTQSRIALQEELSNRMRRLAEKMEKKAEELAKAGRYEEALECYELAGYLKGAADIFEDLV